MTLEESLQQMKTELDDLGRRLAALEGNPKEKSDRRKLPVNKIAYNKAFEAWCSGDRKAMKEYCRYYRIPT